MTDEIQEFWRPQIPSKNLKIWRYIDLTQLLSILERDALWFNRVDNFEDPMEGSFTHANVETREERYKDTEIPDSALNAVSHLRKLSRKISYLNCWHVNNYESAAMWEQYSSGGQGIAIQTTIGDLIDALTEKEGVFDSKEANSKDSNEIERTITFGVVQYIDYDERIIPENNTFAPLFHKRRSFEHEREFRAIFSTMDKKLEQWDNIGTIDPSNIDTKPGEYVEVNLESLIDTLYISPTAPDWFGELVSLVINRYGIECDVNKSSLQDDPVF